MARARKRRFRCRRGKPAAPPPAPKHSWPEWVYGLSVWALIIGGLIAAQ